MVAWVFYVLGSILALRSVVAGLSGDRGVFDWVLGIAFGVAIWWIAVGFGVRLGMHPDEFIAAIKSVLGFGENFDSEEPTREVTNSS
jgi:hypothetical protein